MQKITYTILLCLLTYTVFPQDISIADLFPSKGFKNGISGVEDPQIYSGDELYDLIDGGADIYFEYGFRSAISGQLRDKDNNIIQAEIYEMTDDTAASGIFSMNNIKTGINSGFGAQSNVNKDYISFWKNNYFINISRTSRQSSADETMAMIAAYIDARIPASSRLPAIFKNIKTEGIIQNPVYFRGNIGLSNFYYFDYKNIFNIEDGLYLKYPDFQLFIFHYNEDRQALESFNNAKENLMNNKKFKDFEAVEKGIIFRDQKTNELICCYNRNNLIVLISPEGRQLFHSKNG